MYGNYVFWTTVSVRCPELGGGRFLGGLKCISSTEVAIRSAELARFSEVVRFSEGPLQEVLLYMDRP